MLRFEICTIASPANAKSRMAALANLRTTPVRTCLFEKKFRGLFFYVEYQAKYAIRLKGASRTESLSPILDWSVAKFCLLEKCFSENGMMSLM